MRLAQEALAGWRELEAESGEELLHLNGLLELFREGVVSSEQALRDCNAECELLSREEAARRFGVMPGEDAFVLFQPDAGVVLRRPGAARALRAGPARSRRTTASSRSTTSTRRSSSSAPARGRGDCSPARDRPAGRRDPRDGRVLPARGRRSRRWSSRDRDEGPRLLLARRPGLRAEGRQPHARRRGRPGRRRGRRPGARRARSPTWTASGSRLPTPSPSARRAASTRRPTTSAFVLERHGRIVVGSACSGHGFKFAPAVGQAAGGSGGSTVGFDSCRFYQRLGDVPRKRHIQFRDNGTLLTEEVMGLEGFTGNESILYHLQSPCRVMELGGVRADRARGVGARPARAPALQDVRRRARGRRDHRPAPADVERRRRDLALPPDRVDGLLLPQRRGRRGDLRPRGLAGRSRRSSATLPYKEGDYVVVPRGTTYRFKPEGAQRYLVFETPGLIEIPRRYRNQYGQIVEGAPYYHRDIHPPTELHTVRERGEFPVKVRVRGGYQTYVVDYHPFDVVGWDGYLYPWTFSIHDFEPITGRIHQPPPSHQTFAGPELRDLLVLSAQARLRPAGGADPVPPLESAVGGDDLLRLRQLRLAEGRRGRVDHAASVRPAARAAAGARGEVDRHARDARARGDVRHVPPAAS